ncbi:PREDICTED: uncharacterized protein LOC105450226 [Wasmannia auropunctata]|uniref:uncharacterized protein LOC105450226 n=1 Tax=Wasmannia auropunctata TaxID=64793 RepID=UPI0005ED5EA7|nr:PREDICTED: uncharacterized protein LOC105450226 [Wasmannia auropunctata]
MNFRFCLVASILILDVVSVRSTDCDTSKEAKIVIVGAGPAGIAAASRLSQRGVNDFVILEANDRIGGRIYTKDFGENVVDLGAQWVHGQSGNVVFDLASKHNLLSSFAVLRDNSKHEFVTINGEIMPCEESSKALTIFENILDNVTQIELKEERGSLGDYIIREYYKTFDEKPFMNRSRVDEYLSWMEKAENSADGSDSWFDVSAKRFTEYWECEGDQLLGWKEHGYKTIFDLLLQKIPNAEECLPVMEKIEFGKVVATINYSSGENVTVITRDGCEYSALHVIFTGSLGVLKEKHASIFVPPLSQKKQRAIEGLTIGTVNKVFLEFPHRWWPEDKAGFDFIWPEQDKKEFLQTYGQNNEWLCDVFSIVTVAYQPNLLCAWIVGKNARHMETLSDDDVFDGLYLLLQKSFESHYNVVKPTKMLRSKWYTNEHSRGSYSFQSMLAEQMDVKPIDLAEPIMTGNKPVILFAGEATHDHYYSTVHGAVETGFREADRLIDFERMILWIILCCLACDTPKEAKVVIVGAGAAGIAAASRLSQNGMNDFLLRKEANERPSWQEIASKDVSTKIYWSYWDSLEIKNGVLYKKWEAPNLKESIAQLIVPKKWVKRILEEIHDSPSGGHFGINKTLEKIRKRFYWATCKQDVEDWCRTCKVCVAKKGPAGKGKSPLQIYNVGAPFERVQMDTLGPLPTTTSGNKYLLVVTDCFTKWIEAFPLKNIRAKTITEIFLTQIVARHGVPLEIHTDQGRNFESKIFRELSNVVDLGAQWVLGKSNGKPLKAKNVVYDLASKHGLLSPVNQFDKREFVTINGIIPAKESSEAMLIHSNILDNIKKIDFKGEKKSYGDYLIQDYYKTFDKKPFMNRSRVAGYLSWIEKMVIYIECPDLWFDASAKRSTEYWQCEEYPFLDWKQRGYNMLFDLLVQKIPNAEKRLPVMEKVELEKIVANIDYSSGQNVTVTTRDGCKYSASHVIFTGSLGVLKEKHSSIFVPPLPQKKQRAIEGLSFKTVDKIFLEFPQKWWPEDKGSFDFIWSEQDKKDFLQTHGQNKEWITDVFSFNTVAQQTNVLRAWIVGKNAKYMETLSDTDVLEGLYLLLQKSLGNQYNVVKPTKILKSQWYTNEHFRGSHSFEGVRSEQMDVRPRDLADPIMIGNKPVIVFAGEATHEHYYSLVHGAVDTGFREAERLIKFERTNVNL